MIFSLLLLGALSFLLTGLIYKLALKYQLLDHPNHRSAHVTPTPRAGGLAIVISVFCGLLFIYFNNLISASDALFFLFSSGLVGLSGLLDDKFSLSPAKRLILQLIAVLIGIYGLGYINNIYLFSIINQPYWLILFSILYLLWLTNLYNFMDGINGIASLQAISVGLAMTCTYYFSVGDLDYLPLLIVVTVSGFLYWNFPKAKIFMGDVGSAFLGLSLGLISIKQSHQSPELVFCFLILMGVFIVDASFTLAYRFIQGKKVHQAHSSHAYQHAARWAQSHTHVSLTILGINTLWLFPLAVLVVYGYLGAVVGLLIAYAPLIVLAFRLKAGLDESQITNSTI